MHVVINKIRQFRWVYIAMLSFAAFLVWLTLKYFDTQNVSSKQTTSSALSALPNQPSAVSQPLARATTEESSAKSQVVDSKWHAPGSGLPKTNDRYALFSSVRLKNDPESLAIASSLLSQCTQIGSLSQSLHDFEISSREKIRKEQNSKLAEFRTAELEKLVKSCNGFRGYDVQLAADTAAELKARAAKAGFEPSQTQLFLRQGDPNVQIEKAVEMLNAAIDRGDLVSVGLMSSIVKNSQVQAIITNGPVISGGSALSYATLLATGAIWDKVGQGSNGSLSCIESGRCSSSQIENLRADLGSADWFHDFEQLAPVVTAALNSQQIHFNVIRS
jgi:hypothetical protein